MAQPKQPEGIPRTFVDLFAGCGGFSLGFLDAGWTGLFGIEKNADAFKTLKHNLLERDSGARYSWPDWLAKSEWDVRKLLREKKRELESLRGHVGVVIGGPPCQGFSFAGRRKLTDSRNRLLHVYAKIVSTIQPAFAIVENVRGITVGHGTKEWRDGGRGRAPMPFSTRLVRSLRAHGYVPVTDPQVVRARDFGVPQLRPRYILIAVRASLLEKCQHAISPYSLLESLRPTFLGAKGLDGHGQISVGEAIRDLERRWGESPCTDPASPAGFMCGNRGQMTSKYQELMRRGSKGGSPDSHRFARHRPLIEARFSAMQEHCRPGIQLNEDDRDYFGLAKRSTVVLHARKPSHTLTTLPDDLIHYREPRILTVRESARLQSFPDWFEFKGPYTTGGDRRRKQCPRYTQVGNAVPPLLAEAIGLAMDKYMEAIEGRVKSPDVGSPSPEAGHAKSVLSPGCDQEALSAAGGPGHHAS